MASQKHGVALALGLILGGALGNLADRAFRRHHGSVVDFITLSHWPTFNVADSCITVGVVVLVVLLAGPSRSRRADAVTTTPVKDVTGEPLTRHLTGTRGKPFTAVLPWYRFVSRSQPCSTVCVSTGRWPS